MIKTTREALLKSWCSPQEIKKSRNINDRNYTKYIQKLRDRIVGDQLANRQEYLLQDLDVARERLLADKRQLSKNLEVYTELILFSNRKGSAENRKVVLNHLFQP